MGGKCEAVMTLGFQRAVGFVQCLGMRADRGAGDSPIEPAGSTVPFRHRWEGTGRSISLHLILGGMVMLNKFVLAAIAGAFALGMVQAQASTATSSARCESHAVDKNGHRLFGAAKASFMKRCEAKGKFGRHG